MNYHPHAIETAYRGYLFRSRLEARWAVFYDFLGIPFQYEPEGYDLGGGVRYLPDFFLPQQLCWVEVKGQRPTPIEKLKAHILTQATQKPVFIFVGEIGPYQHALQPETNRLATHGSAWAFAPERLEVVPEGQDYLDYGPTFGWGECPHCHTLTVSLFGAAGMKIPQPIALVSTENACDCVGKGLDCRGSSHTPRLLTAYTAARQARFERFGGI